MDFASRNANATIVNGPYRWVLNTNAMSVGFSIFGQPQSYSIPPGGGYAAFHRTFRHRRAGGG